MKKRTDLDLTEGPVLRKLIAFAVPLCINSMVQNLYSTVDKVMVGQTSGANAMAAVGASTQPMLLMVNLFAGIALGVNVVCANYKGAHKQRELRQCMHSCVVLGLVAGFIVMVAGLLLNGPILALMGTPAAIMPDAKLYMGIRFAGAPVWLLSSFLSNIFYANGQTRYPMVVNLVSGFVNVAFNALFLLVLGMGVEGVAIGTVISQVFNVVAFVLVLYKRGGQYGLRLRETVLRWHYAKKVLAVGLPTGINNTVFSISNAMLQSSVNSFGPVVIAGNSAADSLTSYVSLFMTNMGSAALSATAQCRGARKLDRIDKIMVRGTLGSIAMVAVASAVITVLAEPLLGIFVKRDDPNWQAVINAGIPKTLISCWGYLIYSVSQVFGAGLKGIHKAVPALVCNLAGVILPRLLWVWLVVPNMHTPNMLYAIYPISWAISGVMLVAAFLHYRKKLRLQLQMA